MWGRLEPVRAGGRLRPPGGAPELKRLPASAHGFAVCCIPNTHPGEGVCASRWGLIHPAPNPAAPDVPVHSSPVHPRAPGWEERPRTPEGGAVPSGCGAPGKPVSSTAGTGGVGEDEAVTDPQAGGRPGEAAREDEDEFSGWRKRSGPRAPLERRAGGGRTGTLGAPEPGVAKAGSGPRLGAGVSPRTSAPPTPAACRRGRPQTPREAAGRPLESGARGPGAPRSVQAAAPSLQRWQ